MLVLDAFSGDAPPAHLLTREAFAIYQRHIAHDGIIAVHITNRYVDLAPGRASRGRFLSSRHDADQNLDDDDKNLIYHTDYMLLTNNQEFLKATPPELHPGDERRSSRSCGPTNTATYSSC